MSELEKILEGIDETECETEFGWWETLRGAEFGEGKKADFERVFSQLETKIDEIKEIFEHGEDGKDMLHKIKEIVEA